MIRPLSEQNDELESQRPKKRQLKKSVRPNPLNLKGIQLSDFHKMNYNMDELAEHKIEKQALIEVLFQTQVWSEPYVKNPFLYITDNDADFEGEKGFQLKENLKKVFYLNYKKYQGIVEKVLPAEFWQANVKALQNP